MLRRVRPQRVVSCLFYTCFASRSTIIWLEEDVSKRFHTFTTRWRDDGVDWLVDGQRVHASRGVKGDGVPWEPMSVRVILRPTNKPSKFLGAAHVDVLRVAYTPASSAPSLAQVSPPPPSIPPRSPAPLLPPSATCRSDICGDHASDCCAPQGDVRACTRPGYM
eukprot:5420240-Prymnesium_polylepis.2